MLDYLMFLLIVSSVSFAQDSVCRANTCRYGECEQLPTGFSCHCLKGVKGRNCDQVLYPSESPCLQNPCWNGGTCSIVGGDWSCRCAAPFFGKDCKGVTSSPCVNNNPCKNNGICQLIAGVDAACFCVNEFTGRFCETKLPLCERRLNCYNGATCKNDKCNCAPNYLGEFCQTYSDPSLTSTVRVKNKGGYTAKATLTYRYNNKDQKQTKDILGGGTYTFKYEKPASSIFLSVVAVGNTKKGPFFTDTITEFEQQVCYDVYGALPKPKYTRMKC